MAFDWLSFLSLMSGLMTSRHLTWAIAVLPYSVTNGSDSLLNMTACPGVESLFAWHGRNNTIVKAWPPDCENIHKWHTAHQGVVHGVCGSARTFCTIYVELPQTMRVRAHVRRLEYWCEPHGRGTMIHSGAYSSGFYYISDRDVLCNRHSLEEIFVESEKNRMLIVHFDSPPVRIDIETVNRYSFIIRSVTTDSGYVIAPNVDTRSTLMGEFRDELKVLSKHVIMVSFQQSYNYHRCFHHTKLVYTNHNASDRTVLRVCRTNSLTAQVVPSSRLTLLMSSRFGAGRVSVRDISIHFSSLAESDQPQRVNDSHFNCSVNRYSQFQQHLDCNLKPECDDGRDETEHCPFSSQGCRGLVASRNKCFRKIEVKKHLPMVLAGMECQTLGGRLASIKTRKQQKDFRNVFRNYSEFELCLGFVSGCSLLPFMYSKFWKWSDNTMIYTMDHFEIDGQYHPSRALKTMALKSMRFVKWKEAKRYVTKLILCEIKSQFQSPALIQQVIFLFSANPTITVQTRQSLLSGSYGHMTQSWLFCNLHTHGGHQPSQNLQRCLFPSVRAEQNETSDVKGKTIWNQHAMFQCDDDVTTIHHTLVCDFRQDCRDHSDESFCEHHSCHGFLCLNGQCVTLSQRCNEFSDCLDNSDEKDCPRNDLCHRPVKQSIQRHQIHINLDGTGFFTRHTMITGEPCGGKHYLCPSDSLHCLPVYTLCNELPDCSGAEDEQDCEQFACPGFYRCRSSGVCVHADHLCDGWGQCPMRDDELMCDLICPDGCLCQGHSFLCLDLFTADLFPQLRDVDAGGTGMTLTDFNGNWYLIRLSLCRCALVNISSTKLSHLRFLDLTVNHLDTVDISVLHNLPSLRILRLANNPLRAVTGPSPRHVHYNLKRVDLSRTRFQILNSKVYIFLPKVEYLNLSSSGIEYIISRGFKITPKLTELDIRQNLLSRFPLDLLSRLNRLKAVLSSNYRLCCDSVLPKPFTSVHCLTSRRVFSPCENLLPTGLHVVFFWLVCSSSILGNVFGIIGSFPGKKLLGSSFRTFSVNLQLAHICKGINVSIALAANELYRGQYVAFEKTWSCSVACKVAAFLFLLSSEVSVLIFCFITVDRFLQVRFRGGFRRPDRSSAALACLVTWLAAIALSSVPLLPGQSHWGVDDQSGLCRMALRYNSLQTFHWFTVIIAINSLLLTLTVIALICLYSRTPRHLITTDRTKRSDYSSIQLSIEMAVTDFVCWFLFGVAIVMSFYGASVADGLYETLVIFVSPVHAAVSPVLFLWTVVKMTRQQAQDDRLLEMLKARLRARTKLQALSN